MKNSITLLLAFIIVLCFTHTSAAQNTPRLADKNNNRVSTSTGSTITVTSPNGGERWSANSSKNITWTSVGTIANVQIEYSTNAGVSYSVITPSAPNTGTYAWLVPNTPTASARVRISDAASVTTKDVSNTLFTILGEPPPTLTLTTPNGHENWTAGSITAISWTSTGSIPSVNIEYSTNGGVSYSSIASSMPNTGSYSWTVPNTPTASARVRISNASNPSGTFDVSNALFTIIGEPPPTITVTSPNGGESWTIGTSQTITWTSTGSFANVQIEYSSNAGTTYSVITPSAPNTGSYTWNIPNTPTASARIRISNAANPILTNDVSNTLFTIASPPRPTITIISPNGGERWIANSTNNITWTSTGSFTSVKIEYSKNAGVTYTIIATSAPNNGSYQWTVPNTPTASARVRISDATNETVTKDVSDRLFTILSPVKPTLTLTAPNGGENWLIGANNQITWNSTGTLTTVKLEYSTNAGVSYTTVTSSAPNTGSYTWTIPNSPTTSARVRVSDASNATTKDVSNANFKIIDGTPATLTLTSPNGGESWTTGSNRTITWSSTGNVPSVKIEYSLNSGVSYTVIYPSTPNTGSFVWKIPNAISSAARVRITDASRTTSAADVSDANFSIVNPPSPTITLTSPNGGEQWVIGSTYTITWTTTGTVGNVRLEYSINGGASFNYITTIAPNTGIYSWTIPNNATTTALVRISEAANPTTVRDVSNANFSIVHASLPSITVTYPNGSENLPVGFNLYITWNSTLLPPFAVVIIEYSTNGEAGPYNVISTSAQNSGSYLWAPPEPITSTARVRLSSMANGVPAIDISDADFTISPALSITVTSPHLTDQWMINSTQTISWTSTGVMENVKIEYTTDESFDFTVIAESTPNDGNFSWVVQGPTTTRGVIRISDVANPSILDLSNGYFYIIPEENSLTLTSPNGGEVWQVGSNQNITWASTGTITNIRIEYSTNAGATFSVITGSTPNTGSYTWTVLNSPTAFARIRIADVSNPATHNDVSETNFTIAPPSAPVITITLPNGGENFVIGSNSAINWTTAGTLNNVRIEYSTNGGASFSFITVNTPNTGTYLWNVPNSATSAARIRISDALNPTVTSDMSDANFNIVHSSTPTITITSPNGGEDWSIGTLRYITWTTNGLPSYAVMKIEYSVNGVNGPYTVITTFGTNSGSYYWVPPGPVSSNARIRISTVAQSVTVSDVSDADFTMSPALGITITSPNGGENWKINSFKNITWNSSGSISNVKIEYSTNGNTTFSLVAASAPNTGSYTWQVPGPATPYGSMRISAVGNPSVRDLSNTFFTVSTQTPGVPEPPDTRATMSSFEPETTIPDVFALHEAYPNPFNPLTVIRYQLSVNSQVSLKVYNILGNEVVTLVDEMQDAGYKSITFDANELPSGIYYYRLQAGTFSDMKKVLLIK